MNDTLAAALDLHDRGLAVVPAAADDGKSVAGVIGGFQNWRCRLPREKVKDLFTKHPNSCIALLVGHCNIVVVDCDSDDALAVAEARFGHSPILVRTPGGRGGHLYYGVPSNTPRQANLRHSENLAIDIKAGKGAYVIAPPSVRPSNGIAYRFERGSWDDLPNLPTYCDSVVGIAPPRSVTTGQRNDSLFHRAMCLAGDCETLGELEMKAQAVNKSDLEPALPYEEVKRVAASAWKYQTTGRNMVGRGKYVITPEARFERLADHPDALTLDIRMRLNHEGLRSHFCASPKGMARHEIIPGWTDRRYRAAIKILLERSVWVLLKQGGRGAGDPHKYWFAERSSKMEKGARIAPNTNKTPRAPSSTDQATEDHNNANFDVTLTP